MNSHYFRRRVPFRRLGLLLSLSQTVFAPEAMALTMEQTLDAVI